MDAKDILALVRRLKTAGLGEARVEISDGFGPAEMHVRLAGVVGDQRHEANVLISDREVDMFRMDVVGARIAAAESALVHQLPAGNYNPQRCPTCGEVAAGGGVTCRNEFHREGSKKDGG